MILTVRTLLPFTDDRLIVFLKQANDFILLYTGFINAEAMAQKYRANPISPNDPMKNADSHALFAVGAWITSQSGVAISQDGTFTKPQTNPKARS
jgi:hypothetical protein